ncbi:MAG TPA: serine/threonine-protein kinase, partial [Pirellulaceae bacterium]|nr:serine/threonine-protein kinase [Pirellulaceae bacterium]
MKPGAAALPARPALPSSGLEAGVEIGDFRIERRLGAGGMGIVYQARQLSLNRPVALKVLGQALSRGTDVTRFQREAQAAARLRHPAIAHVYFIGQDRHLCYLAMELIEGASLRKVLDRLGTAATSESSLDSVVRDDLSDDPEARVVRFDVATEDTSASPPDALPAEINPYLSPQARELRTSAGYVRRACEVVRDAARALAHAHEQGVIHRDIKPDNLLLDRHGRVHLIDFGVARFFEDQAVTYTGQLVGTPLYMSPEQ